MTAPFRETRYANRHIKAVLSAAAGYATQLPGGIHRGVAPKDTAYPFLVFAYASGQEQLVLNSNPFDSLLGAGLLYLLKVQDDSTDGSKASDAADWVEEALFNANGSNASGTTVWTERISPFSLPVPEGDRTIQQEGATYRFWVERP